LPDLSFSSQIRQAFATTSRLCAARPNPSIERTVSSGLRPLPTAAHVKNVRTHRPTQMFPLSENLGFWAFTAALCAVVYLVMRRHVRKQLVTAPKESLRSTSERALHWASLFLLVLPLGYVILIDGEPFWAAFAILWVQAGSMFSLRLLRVRYTIRVWLLLPIAVASVLVGAIVAIWPSIEPLTLRSAPWFFLAVTAILFALSSVISLYSFPAGYGERAH